MRWTRSLFWVVISSILSTAVAISALLMAWEWSRIYDATPASLALHAGTAVIALTLAGLDRYGLALVVVVAGAALAWLVAGGSAATRRSMLTGVVYLIAPCVAMLWLRAGCDSLSSITPRNATLLACRC